MTIVENPYKDYKKLKKEAKIYGADNNRIFSLTNIRFSKTGIYYLDGIINDYIVIDIPHTNKKKQDLIREIENEVRVTFKVVVLSPVGASKNLK